MRRFTLLSCVSVSISLLLCNTLWGQAIMGKYPAPSLAGTHTGTATTDRAIPTAQSVMAKNAMTAAPLNYKSFTSPYKTTTKEATTANAGYENHPEAGMLYPGTPCDNCYELIGKRTEMTKTFQKEGISEDGGKDIMVQTSTMPMHYRDEAGNWRTITTYLEPDNDHNGVYAAMAQPAPVVINATDKFSSLGKAGESIRFNNNPELIYVQPDGTETSLGNANWEHHTAGDDGVYVTNAWPGIDMEMHTGRGAIKTNFYINHPMPEYAGGKLLVRDHVQTDKGLSLVATEGTKHTQGTLEIRDEAGITKYGFSVVSVYEHADLKGTIKLLDYALGENNTLDIELPGSYMNKPASAYPIIIDPLVSLATTTTPITGATYNALWTAGVGCTYFNAAMTPPNCTVTDIQFAFAYTTTTVAMEYVGFSFYMSGLTCRSPGPASGGLSWSCGPLAGGTLPGTCTAIGGATYSIFTDMSPCLPAPSCPSIPLNITMYFYQNWLTTPPCATTYVTGSAPLVITVIGHTIEFTATGTPTGAPTTICAGESVTLNGAVHYGVPPYIYTWTPGPVTGVPATVTPSVTTTYTLTVLDACNVNSVTGTVTITVNPTSPILGTLSMCIGNTTTLTDATAGGTWSSSTVSVATVGLASGVVTGVATGTSTITYTTPAGCKAYAVVTVTPLPVAITGTTFMCQGATTTLNDATPGCPWSSSNTAIATVSAGGVVTGVTAGTATITYGSPGCIATITVTVNPTPVISSTAFTDPTQCNGSDGTITLSGLTAGATYTVHYTGPGGAITLSSTADATGNILITGLPAGTYNGFTVTNSFGCTSAPAGPVVLTNPPPPPVPTVTNNSPVCDGGTVTFNATDPATGITYSWTGPGGFTSTLQGPVINPAGLPANGTYTVTVTTALGCKAQGTTIVTVNPVPVLTIVSNTNPTQCLGSDGTITIDVINITGSLLYNVIYTYNTVAYGYPLTSDGAGNIVIPGLTAGNYNGIYVVTPAGCISNTVGPVELMDPPPPPVPIVTTNEPLCMGRTLYITATDSAQGGFYTWTFPNGATETIQDIIIPVTTYADTGIYTVTYNIANCISVLSQDIPLYPQITLTNLTANTAITYGSSIQLNADGALYYWWFPDNGTLNNPNINNPVATPKDSTVYTVIGTSQWGCKDTAEITIAVINTLPVVIPSGFTPNGDGLNDIFRLGNLTYQKLVDFSVYNRWGQLVYHNTYDPKSGWDGTFNGVPQDMGVYNYSIILSNPDGTNTIYKGDVTLVR